MFSTFEEMITFYKRRNIFNQNDMSMIQQEVVYDKDSFWIRIVRPKLFQGRLNHGDLIRIAAILE